ncbi:hypothetical protein LXM94_15700 [Rhizobium sp. TRM95111]|uniref:hypothetical protein n=1 Tax=Rhizobium alarense TaxID=2846851 RepID=UPI001F2952B6|nr:hypothetical protein [Rhizobium alarense]MCF3641418.1 hypothetical protein [Rhizobium alarense]
MFSIIAALAQNLFFRVEGRFDMAMTRVKRNAAVCAVTVVFLASAYCLSVVATCVALAARFGTVPALFGLAGGFVLAALILIGVMILLNRRDRRRRRARQRRIASRNDMLALAAALARNRPLAATAVGVALALLLPAKSRRRRHRDD